MCMHAHLYPTLCDPVDCSPPAPQSTEFTRQEYWSVLLFPLPGNLLNPGIEPTSLVSPAFSVVFFTTEPLGKSYTCQQNRKKKVDEMDKFFERYNIPRPNLE